MGGTVEAHERGERQDHQQDSARPKSTQGVLSHSVALSTGLKLLDPLTSEGYQRPTFI